MSNVYWVKVSRVYTSQKYMYIFIGMSAVDIDIDVLLPGEINFGV